MSVRRGGISGILSSTCTGNTTNAAVDDHKDVSGESDESVRDDVGDQRGEVGDQRASWNEKLAVMA
jgi:hypothetical protein